MVLHSIAHRSNHIHQYLKQTENGVKTYLKSTSHELNISMERQGVGVRKTQRPKVWTSVPTYALMYC